MIFWALALLWLVFFSKLSLAFLGVPAQIPFLVFQHGLHPYLNIILNFALGLPLLLQAVRSSKDLKPLCRSHLSLIGIVLMILFLETLLQVLFFESHKGFYAWAALLSTFWLILIFGVLLPAVLTPERTLKFIGDWSLFFVVLSLALWILRPDLSFKGGRFIGAFKHIPYMVTCASVAVIFNLARLTSTKSAFARAGYSCGIFLSLLALVLTGTRSALAAVAMAMVLWILRVPGESFHFRYFKYSAALVMTVVTILFGGPIASYAMDIATGKKGLVEREAQDGVASRLEEVQRGWEYFQTSPWIGQGLLSKFSGKDSLEVSSYNSFKDPHNIFASAGVVGGWPFLIWTGFFLILLGTLSFKALLSEDVFLQIFGIYAVVQIPILIIYHWHLSLGGMADRFYWLVFGYLALQVSSQKASRREKFFN